MEWRKICDHNLTTKILKEPILIYVSKISVGVPSVKNGSRGGKHGYSSYFILRYSEKLLCCCVNSNVAFY